MNVTGMRVLRVDIVWRRFRRCRVEHAVMATAYSDGTWIEAISLCTAYGDGFARIDHVHYRRCRECIALARKYKR